MKEQVKVFNSSDDISVEYEVLTPEMSSNGIDSAICELQNQIDDINQELQRYTNNADWLDNTVAVASGIICGIIDSFFVREFSFENAHEWGKDKVDNAVVKIAQAQGYKGDDLAGAVKYLEEKFPIAADKATNDFGGGLQHHLRDFSHHPTVVGLVFSLITQFTKKVYGTDVSGKFIVVELDEKGLLLLGKNTPEKITFGVINWIFHMVSDMAGSSCSILEGKDGTGLPGPLVSLLKEISALPIFKKTNEKEYKEFSVWISKLFNGTLLGKRDENGKVVEAIKFDLRTEIGVLNELGKQAVPVIINECIVRGFYFIRKLIDEIKSNEIHSFSDLGNINWKNTIPAKNRTIVRMLTISSGTFMAVDMADAAIRAAVNSGGTVAGFAGQFLLRVNFIGIGRFAVAVGVDVSMGVKKNKLEAQRSSLKSQMLYYQEAKVFYKSGDVWKAVSDASEAIDNLAKDICQAGDAYSSMLNDMDTMSVDINKKAKSFAKNNPDTTAAILDILSED